MALRPGSMGVFDPTEVHDRARMRRMQSESFIKVALYLIAFFFYLYK